MFDGSLPEIGDLAALDDAALVDAAGGWARTENAACARKLALMAELFARRTGLPGSGRTGGSTRKRPSARSWARPRASARGWHWHRPIEGWCWPTGCQRGAGLRDLRLLRR